MQNLGYPTTFLGLNVIRDADLSITINQFGYIERTLSRFNVTTCRPAKTPLDPSLPLLKAWSNDKQANILLYQEIVGSLNHLAVYSRLDITFPVCKLSQFLIDPTESHMSAARHLLRYLKYSHHYYHLRPLSNSQCLAPTPLLSLGFSAISVSTVIPLRRYYLSTLSVFDSSMDVFVQNPAMHPHSAVSLCIFVRLLNPCSRNRRQLPVIHTYDLPVPVGFRAISVTTIVLVRRLLVRYRLVLFQQSWILLWIKNFRVVASSLPRSLVVLYTSCPASIERSIAGISLVSTVSPVDSRLIFLSIVTTLQLDYTLA
jgi:hypothetical protein